MDDNPMIEIGEETFRRNTTGVFLKLESGESEIPEAIWQFRQLEILTVRGTNAVSSFASPPSSHHTLVYLKELILINTNVQDIPEAIWKAMPNLSKLSFSDNPVTHETLRGAFMHLPLLDNLRISEIIPHSLPPSIKHAQNIKNLEITNSSLRFLPGRALQFLRRLRYLAIRDAQNLERLPANIGSTSMMGLQYLFIDRARNLSRIPSSIGNLVQLRVIRISGTKINKVPESIGNIRDLERLTLMDNMRLTTLPESLGQLSNLRYINLDGNANLESLPESIGHLPHLRTLSISNTRIRTLPASLQNNPPQYFYMWNTPLASSVGDLSRELGTTTVTTYTEQPTVMGGEETRREVFAPGQPVSVSPPSLLNIVSTYVYEHMLS